MLGTLITAIGLGVGSPGGVGVHVSQDSQSLYVSIVNTGDKNANVPQPLTTNAVFGNLTLELRKNAKIYKKRTEGYPPPGAASGELVSLMPMHSFGVVLNRKYIQRAYSLGEGCYRLVVVYHSKLSKKPSFSVRSNEVEFCSAK